MLKKVFKMLEIIYEYAKTKTDLELEPDMFNKLIKEVESKKETINNLIKLFEDFIDYNRKIWVLDDNELRPVKLLERQLIFPFRKDMYGKIINAVGANHPILTKRSCVIFQIKEKKKTKSYEISVQGPKKIVPKELNEESSVDDFPDKIKEIVDRIFNVKVDKHFVDDLLESGRVEVVKRDRITLEIARNIILRLLFPGGKPKLSKEQLNCSLCGTNHQFSNVKIFPPLNIASEKYSNFDSYCSKERNISFCPYCAYLIVKTNLPENLVISNFGNFNAIFIPYHFTGERIKSISDELFKFISERNDIACLIDLPLQIESRIEDAKKIRGFDLFEIFYLISRGGESQELISEISISKVSELYKVGKKLRESSANRTFKDLLQKYIKSQKRKARGYAYKEIFQFFKNLFENLEIDFNFVKKIVRVICNSSNNPILTGQEYLKAFLEVSSMERSQILKASFDYGEWIGKTWRNVFETLEKRGKNPNENRFKSMVRKLDSTSPSVMHNILRKMIAEISETLGAENVPKIDSIIPHLSGDRYLRNVFLTGIYFGYFSKTKIQKENKNELGGDING